MAFEGSTAFDRELAMLDEGVNGDPRNGNPSSAPLNSLNSLNSHAVEKRKKPVLDSAALYGLAGDVVKKIEPYTEASIPAMLIQLLAAFGVMVNRTPYFEFGRSRHYLKVNYVLVGPSGSGRKGTSWDEVSAVVRRVNEDFPKLVVSGLSSGEGLIQHVRDPLYKKTPIRDKGEITRYQDEMIDEGVEEKRLLVVEPEFSRVLKVASRESNILSEVVRDAFDKDVLRVMTKNGVKASGVHIAIGGHITEYELLRELDDTAKANGFANRFNWIWTERSKLLPFGGDMPESELNDSVRRLSESFRFSLTVNRIIRTALADELWSEVYEPLASGYTGLMEALTSRAHTHVTRMACIYALLDKSEVIDYDHLKAALALWQYAEDSARYVFGNATGDKVADLILSALTENPDGLAQTDISHLLGRHCKADVLNATLDRLEKLGRVARRQEATAGRSRTVFTVAGAK